MDIQIVKRDGKKEVFSIHKIKNAVAKAFLSVNCFATEDMLTNILCRLNVSDGTTVEEIQNQVELALWQKVIMQLQNHTCFIDRSIQKTEMFVINLIS